jgi:WD40 repeat protein
MAPRFMSKSTICYISGNCINSMEIPTMEEDGCKFQNIHSKVFSTGAQIKAFAYLASENVFGICERFSPLVTIIKWSPASGLTTKLSQLSRICVFKAVDEECDVESMSFSYDGRYLAVLGGIPNYNITIWDYKTQKLIVTVANKFAANFISFNPADSSLICVSGGDGALKVWKIKNGHKKVTLLPM